MNVLEIKKKLASGELILDGNKLYTKSEYEQIQQAEQQAEHYDLLQLTKKIQL